MTTASLTATRPSWWSKFTSRLSFSQLLMVSWGAFALKTWQIFVSSGTLSLTGLLVYSVWMALICACAYLYLWNNPRRQLNRLSGWLQKLGLGPIAWVVSMAVVFCDWLSLPVMAQTTSGPSGTAAGFFFRNIQTKITGIFGSSPNATVINPIVVFSFGVLQLLFIIYIAFQVAKVVAAANQEEDWKQTAKTPLIVAAAVIGGDFAIGLV